MPWAAVINPLMLLTAEQMWQIRYRGYSQSHIRKIKREHSERYLRRMVKEANA